MKEWYSASELVGLSGMPSIRENVARKARIENWHSRRRTGRGGGREYAFASLPEETQNALSTSSFNQTDFIEQKIASLPIFQLCPEVFTSLCYSTRITEMPFSLGLSGLVQSFMCNCLTFGSKWFESSNHFDLYTADCTQAPSD